jgi:hypothetical protein
MVKRATRLRIYKRRMAEMILLKERIGSGSKSSSDQPEAVSDDSATQTTREAYDTSSVSKNVPATKTEPVMVTPDRENKAVPKSKPAMEPQRTPRVETLTRTKSAFTPPVSTKPPRGLQPIPTNLRTSSNASVVSDLGLSDGDIVSQFDEIKKFHPTTNRLGSYLKENRRHTSDGSIHSQVKGGSKSSVTSTGSQSVELPSYYVRHKAQSFSHYPKPNLVDRINGSRKKRHGSHKNADPIVEPSGEDLQYNGLIINQIMDQARRQASFKAVSESQSTLHELTRTAPTEQTTHDDDEDNEDDDEDDILEHEDETDDEEIIDEPSIAVSNERSNTEKREETPYGCSVFEELDEIKRDMKKVYKFFSSNIAACNAHICTTRPCNGLLHPELY